MTPLIRDVFIALLAAGVGLFVGHFASQFHALELKKEVGLGDVMNFAITIIFAFVLQNYLQKRFGNERAQKDHIIDLIKDSTSYFRETRATFLKSYDNKKISKDEERAVKALLRNLINSIGILKESLNACGYSHEEAECAALEGLYQNYKRSLTGGSFPTKAYDGEIFNEAETVYGKAISKLNRMRIDLNKK